LDEYTIVDLPSFATFGRGSSRVEAQWRLKLASVEEMSKSFAEDAIPFFQRVQLLGIFPRLSQEACDTNTGSVGLVARAMRAANQLVERP
jgi:hypothetical protein